MEQKEQLKKIYEKLSDDNKNVLNLVANGMIVAQEKGGN